MTKFKGHIPTTRNIAKAGIQVIEALWPALCPQSPTISYRQPLAVTHNR